MSRHLLVRLSLCLLGVLAWLAILVDNATTSFCLAIPCCQDVLLYEGNPITSFFMSIFGLDLVLIVNSLLGLVAIVCVYEKVSQTMTNRAIWLGVFFLLLLIVVRGHAAINNWSIFVRFFLGET